MHPLLFSLFDFPKATKLVELYKETSEECSKKGGELEGVIKALEVYKKYFLIAQ